MAKLKWDQTGERFYETGTSKGVLFKQKKNGDYAEGVAWNGLVGVSQNPDGAEENPLYADNIKYLSLFSAENNKGTIRAYTYPEEFEECDGSVAIAPGVHVGQQNRVPFGLVYSTVVGNDTEGSGFGEKMHFIYNAKVSPSERAYETINEDPDAIELSWDYTTTPVDLSDLGLDPSAGVTVSSVEVGEDKFKALQDLVYGSNSQEPTLPTIQEIVALTGQTQPDPEE